LSGERVAMLDEPALGLIGGHYDLLRPAPFLPPLYLGLGGYGAVVGERGGFFVLGVSAGLRLQLLPPLALELGGFVGGGGGGSAAQGSGLMLRPHLGVEGTVAGLGLRAELVWVQFPTGQIESAHVSLGVTLPDSLHLLGPSAKEAPLATAARGGRIRIGGTAATYLPDEAAVRISGQAHPGPMWLAGIRLDRYLGDHLFVPLMANGAWGGDVGGYMDVQSGLGLSVPFADWLGIDLYGLVGGAGGGTVFTGGGLLLQPGAGLWFRFGQVVTELSVGRLFAPQGRFGGYSATLLVALESERIRLPPDSGLITPQSSEPIEVDRWTTLFTHKTYVRAQGQAPLQLLGAGLERPVTGWLALTGRGYAAYLGGAGGYAEGLLGVQLRATPLSFAPAHGVQLDLQVGASGGGGLEVDSGLIAQATAQYRLRFARSFELGVGVGRVMGLLGPFSATVLQADLSWALEFPVYSRSG